jgi:hypothetical protein
MECFDHIDTSSWNMFDGGQVLTDTVVQSDCANLSCPFVDREVEFGALLTCASADRIGRQQCQRVLYLN